MNLHSVVRTAFSVSDYAAAAREADPTLSRESVGVLWAQYALETGRGSACWCNNIGNVKVTPAQARAGVPFFMLPGTWEILGGKRVVFDPPDEQTWFRWFPSLSEAMRHHLSFLAARYGEAWAALRSGDPTAFALALKKRGYYTGSEATYAASLRHLLREFVGSSEWPVDPNEVTIASIAHGSHVVDWALATRRQALGEAADATEYLEGEVAFLGVSRYEEAA